MSGAIRTTTISTVGGMAETAVPLPLRTGSFVLCQALVNQSVRVKIPMQKKMKLPTRQALTIVASMTKMRKTMTTSKEAGQTKTDSTGRLHDDITFFVIGFFYFTYNKK